MLMPEQKLPDTLKKEIITGDIYQVVLLTKGQCKPKCAALVQLAVHANCALVPFDDFGTNVQAYA